MCRCATSWCDLDLTFDLAVVTLTYKILSGLCLGNCKVYEVDAWYGYWLGVVGAASWCDHDLTFNLAVVTLTCKILLGLWVCLLM